MVLPLLEPQLISMKNAVILQLAVLGLCMGTSAHAQQAPVPVFAQIPPADVASPWAGLSFGTEFVTQFSKGQKARAGADGFVAYDRALDNHWTIGVSASAGYVPYALAGSPYKSVDFASSQIKLGYDMGQFKPYVTVGLNLAKANSGLSASSGDSVNNLFANSGGLRVSPTVGAGFDYQINNTWSVGAAVQVQSGGALIAH